VTLPAFPYGAVYFRKSNPPREDWARDYRTAAEDGLNAFRHWFLWSAIEVAPGVYDWDDYDRQLDLAAANGMTTVIAEFTTTAPEWAWRQYAHARYQDAAGRSPASSYSASTVVGGFPGLCLDNEDVLALAERFLANLAERYRAHPGLGGYDVWNECNVQRAYCYCPATIARFREWLRARYGDDVRAVGRAWHRPGYVTWDDVDAPRTLGPYPDALDWLQFRIDNAYRLMRWRVDTLRRLDPHHAITAHGVAQTLTDHALGANDEWRAAAEVDSFGFTFIAARRGDEPWKHFHAVDLVRAGCTAGQWRGVPAKPFWHSEAQAGPLWLQPQVVGRPRDDGRIATAEDVRYWSLASFAGGATGWFCPRWRPLLDGPLFGAFGMYGMDGSRTPRSEMTGRLATWASDPAQETLWRARPVLGEVAILFCPESNLFNQLQQGSTDWYAEAARGAYQGFFDLNVQPDWLHVDDLISADGQPAPYRLIYLPFPVHLRSSTAQKLRAWVEQGGVLVSEGCPAYFGDRGHVGTVQPNLGLDALFGAREAYVEFTPDISDDVTFSFDAAADAGARLPGALHLQAYAPTTGRAAGAFAEAYGYANLLDGAAAVVEHSFGAGRTLLIGCSPGAARHRAASPVQRRGSPSGSTYQAHTLAAVAGPSADERRAASSTLFGALLTWAGLTPHLRTTNPAVVARLHRDPVGGRLALWVLNPSRTAQEATLTLSDAWSTPRTITPHWGDAAVAVDGRVLTVTVPRRDALVLALE
jgi:beta-galactosidase